MNPPSIGEFLPPLAQSKEKIRTMLEMQIIHLIINNKNEEEEAEEEIDQL